MDVSDLDEGVADADAAEGLSPKKSTSWFEQAACIARVVPGARFRVTR